MKEKRKKLLTGLNLTVLAAVLVFNACEGIGLDIPHASVFSTRPELTFASSETDNWGLANQGQIQYSFTAAKDRFGGEIEDVTYTVFVVPGVVSDHNELIEVIIAGGPGTQISDNDGLPLMPDTPGIFAGTPGVLYSAVVMAVKDNYTDFSEVVQGRGHSAFAEPPELIFSSDNPNWIAADNGKIQYSFSPARDGNNASISAAYTVFIAEGEHHEVDDVIDNKIYEETRLPIAAQVFTGTAGEWYSAVVRVELNEDKAYSSVARAQAFEFEDLQQGDFTTAPVLTFTSDVPEWNSANQGWIRYGFTPAAGGDSEGVIYTVYIAPGQITTADTVRRQGTVFTGLSPDTNFTFSDGTPGSWYSAVVYARRGNYTITSAVIQAQAYTIFSTAPVLTFTGDGPGWNVNNFGHVQYSFTAAKNPAGEDIPGVSYTVYVAEGQINSAGTVMQRAEVTNTTIQPGAAVSYPTGRPDRWFSAVVYAALDGQIINSAVLQAQAYKGYMEFEGTGTLVSLGKTTVPGRFTYYVDAERGNDSNDGRTPITAWRTLEKVNNTVFQPGDHILLEANSIWNGVGSYNSNRAAHLAARGNGGMLSPQGNGTAERRIVIDLYDTEEVSGMLNVYYSSNKRPIINGNGTPHLAADNPYGESGAINFNEQDFWHVRNLEATNSYRFPEIASNPDLLRTHWDERIVPKNLAVVAVHGGNQYPNHARGFIMEYIYAHDGQTLHNNNGNSYRQYTSNEFGTPGTTGGKGGGFIVVATETTVQYCIVKRTGLEGLRTQHGNWGYNMVFRGNFIEMVAGDGMVMSRSYDSLVESNLIKDANAGDHGSGNYASNWAYVANRILYQFNESYGTMYGNLDGEAWDVDGECNNVIYQYNFSHHNVGGTILFMGSQNRAIFRYNISVNDGTGGQWLAGLTDPTTDPLDPRAQYDRPNDHSYVNYPRGQSLIHYAWGGYTDHSRVPLVHNNTFYIGDGYDVGIVGNTSSSGELNKQVRFLNNIIVKDGPVGVVRIGDNHNPPTASRNPAAGGFQGGVLRNNIFWAPNQSQFVNSGNANNGYGGNQIASITNNTNPDSTQTSGNMWINPQLRIQSLDQSEKTAIFRQLRNDRLPQTDFNDPQKIRAYVNPDRLRMRAQWFSPQAGSPAIEAGRVLPVVANLTTTDATVLRSAWNGHIHGHQAAGYRSVDELTDYPTPWTAGVGITRDFFNNPINTAAPPIGAAAGPVVIP
ncbi:MAG: hypothetical protein FWG89_03275 [Treponema sp.]|nr:hypothetical protein [Treponema sp.]